MRQRLQVLAIRHNGIGIAGRHFGRRGGSDVSVQFGQLRLGLGRENNRLGHQRFLAAFLCSAESVARTSSAETARDGSAFRAS
jgi:hypothetical protein